MKQKKKKQVKIFCTYTKEGEASNNDCQNQKSHSTFWTTGMSEASQIFLLVLEKTFVNSFQLTQTEDNQIIFNVKQTFFEKPPRQRKFITALPNSVTCLFVEMYEC